MAGGVAMSVLLATVRLAPVDRYLGIVGVICGLVLIVILADVVRREWRR